MPKAGTPGRSCAVLSFLQNKVHSGAALQPLLKHHTGAPAASGASSRKRPVAQRASLRPIASIARAFSVLCLACVVAHARGETVPSGTTLAKSADAGADRPHTDKENGEEVRAALFAVRDKVLLAEPWEGCGSENQLVVIKAVASREPRVWKVQCPNGERMSILQISLKPMTFRPTLEWQVLPPGVPVPKGCEFRTVLGMGTEVRLSAIRV